MRLPGRRPITLLALTAVAAASGVLAVPVQTAAQARGRVCFSASAHGKHHVRACSQSRHRAGARRTAKPRVEPPAKSVRKGAKHRRQGAKHATKHVRKHASRKVARKTTRKARRKAAAPRTAKAKCEDGSIPARTGTDSFTCDDASEPFCEGGSYPIVARSGKTLICNGPAKTGSGPASPVKSEVEEAVCEDGSSPVRTGPNIFACDDGSEPSCEEGNYLSISSDGSTLQCVSEEAEG